MLAKPISIFIEGADSDGSDAPTVDDLIRQLEDFTRLLNEVDEAISSDGTRSIQWRVTNVSKNSPISLELTPFSEDRQTNIDRRVTEVVKATSNGINLLLTSNERPKYFDDKMLRRAEKLASRIDADLVQTRIDLSEYSEAPDVIFDQKSKSFLIKSISSIKKPEPTPYKEIGSLEGLVTKIEKDGYGRAVIWIRTRLDSQDVKCVAQANALDRFGNIEVEKVWQGLRINLEGIIRYKSLGLIESMTAENVKVFSQERSLPRHTDIIDKDYTNGIESVEYLNALRGTYE